MAEATREDLCHLCVRSVMYDSDGETDFPNPRSHVVMPLRRTTCIVETSHFDHVAGVQFFVDRRFYDTIARKCNQLNYYIIVRK